MNKKDWGDSPPDAISRNGVEIYLVPDYAGTYHWQSYFKGETMSELSAMFGSYDLAMSNAFLVIGTENKYSYWNLKKIEEASKLKKI